MSSRDILEIKNYIEKILNGKLSRSELNRFIIKCWRIAEGYYNTGAQRKYFNIGGDVNGTDSIAKDAVSELFIKNSRDRLVIEDALRRFETDSTDENELVYYLYQIIFKRVEQTIVKKLKERDPVFAKIHKNIAQTILLFDYKRESYLGKIYILEADNSIEGNNLLTYEELDRFPLQLFLSKREQLLDGLFRYTKENTEFNPALPLNDLIIKLKSIYLNVNTNVENNFYTDIDINNSIETALEKINRKIMEDYFKKGKISEEEAGKLKLLFGNLSMDLKNGGMHGSLFKYLRDVWEEINKELFYQKYHAIVNYLYKDFRSSIKDYLDE